MLVEIPDPEVILGVIGAFLAGLFVFFIAYRLKPLMNLKSDNNSYDLDRLEYYEKQLIDMKIRLDAQDVMNDIEKPTISVPKTNIPLIEDGAQTHTPNNSPTQSRHLPNIGHGDVTSHVLGLITKGPMTSRDIQNSIGRSREHTSRLMKKFFQEGYVQRNTNSKPYTYSITDKGKGKASSV